MQEVPTWWLVISFLYFLISIVWSVALVVGMLCSTRR